MTSVGAHTTGDYRIHVLHVDDEPDFADLTATYLEREHSALEVTTATSANEALDRLQSEQIDCIVSDFDMPGMTGIELLEEVRLDNPKLPFILFTGKGSEDVASEAVSAGVTDYLQKETGTDQYTVLANRIDNAVSRSRAERRASEHERKLELLRDVNQALVSATTREEIATALTEILATSDRYVVSWIGTVGDETDRVLPCKLSGAPDADASPTALPIAAAADDPVTTAVESGEIRVTRAPEPVLETWRPTIDAVPYEAAIIVPLRYQGRDLGVLSAYAPDAGTIDDAERDLFDEIGGDLAQALFLADGRRRLRRHRTAVEAVPEGVFVLDEGGQIILTNEAAASLLDREPEEVKDRYFATFVEEGVFQESVTEWYVTAVREMLSSDSDRATAWYETEIHPQDGNSRLVEIHLSLRPFEDEYRGTVGIIRDVTDRRDRQRELSHQQSVLEAVVETVPQGILVVDEDREFFTYNEEFVEMWGIPQEVVETGSDEQALASVLDSLADPEQFLETVDYYYDNPVEKDRDRIRLADGRIFERYTAPVTVESGEYFGRVWIFEDVTDVSQRKRELERYETLVEEAASGVFAQDADGRYSFVNSHIEKRTGYDRSEIIGERPTMFLPEADVTEIDDGIREMLNGERDRLTFESSITAADGEEIPIEGQLALLPSDDGFNGTVGVVRDISERKARERHLERQNERLDRFAGLVSHDLRNPLNLANGRLDLVDQECDSEHIAEIERAHRRMERLIEDLLRLTREGESVDNVESVDLAALAETCWRHAGTDEAELVIRTERSIAGDRGQVRQLLENLLRNAVEHGGAEVTVTIGDMDDRTGFYVADDGPGISEGERERVFETGYSGSNGGTGVGLAVVDEIASSHRWTVSVDESEAGGAR